MQGLFLRSQLTRQEMGLLIKWLLNYLNKEVYYRGRQNYTVMPFVGSMLEELRGVLKRQLEQVGGRSLMHVFSVNQ